MVDALLTERIKSLAESIEIDALGFADASEFSGYALSNSRRRDPRLTIADAQTILGMVEPAGFISPNGFSMSSNRWNPSLNC